MKYYVTFAIDARYVAEVEAYSVDEALDMAQDEYCNADFGVVEVISGEATIIEDENGNYIWER